MPAIHAGMTEFAFSFFVGEPKIMNHSFENVAKGVSLNLKQRSSIPSF
jgi:hypothetical protein